MFAFNIFDKIAKLCKTRISVAPKVPPHSSFDTGWAKPFDEFFYTISPTNAFVWQFFLDVLQMDRMSYLIVFIVSFISCVTEKRKFGFLLF